MPEYLIKPEFTLKLRQQLTKAIENCCAGKLLVCFSSGSNRFSGLPDNAVLITVKDGILSVHVGETPYVFTCDEVDAFMDVLAKAVAGREVGCVGVLDVISRLEDPQPLLRLCRRIAQEYACPVLIGAANASYKEVCYRLLGGESVPAFFCGVTPCTDAQLHRLSESCGLSLASAQDVITDDASIFCSDALDGFASAGSTLHQHLDYYKRQADAGAQIVYFLRTYLPCAEKTCAPCSESADRPFLSVVMRTQGRRADAMREAILCLVAQSSQNFEFLLVGHNLTSAGRDCVNMIVDELPPSFREHMRFCEVQGGGRSRPLNFALEHARGQYIAFFDDDDLLMADWAESFEEAAKEAPGALLHAYAVYQEWTYVKTQGEDGLMALDKPVSAYCSDFNWSNQFSLNRCPFMSVAFPLDIMRQFGILFDETLNTTEDWDCIMRSATLCGVKDIPKVTAIYRLWKNKETSQTLHSQSEWRQNEFYIKEKLAKIPLMLPAGYLMNHGTDASSGLSLILRKPGGAEVELHAESKSHAVGGLQQYTFTPAADTKWGKNVTLSWAGRDVIISDPIVSVTYTNGESIFYRAGEMTSTGVRRGASFLFLFRQPQLNFSIAEDKGIPVSISVSYAILPELSYRAVLPYCFNFVPVLARMALERVKRAVHRFLHTPSDVSLRPVVFAFYARDPEIAQELSPLATTIDGANCTAQFQIEDPEDFSHFRFDPADQGAIAISSLRVTLSGADGAKIADIDFARSNGIHIGKTYYFHAADPQLYLKPFAYESPSLLTVSCTASPLPKAMYIPCMAHRVLRKIASKLHLRRILNKLRAKLVKK